MIATGEDGGNIRFWFVPNEMKLQRSIDSVTGKATIVFEEASIELKTESMMMGLPQSPIARDFADHFNIYYDDFAELEFPVQSPDNPEVIINVKIFKRLREAMQAVSLARFFRDNDIPVDMWWLNNWQPPYASSAKTIASAYREVSEGGRHITICGGVNINKPNTYIPSPEAESIGQLVTSSRTPVADQEVQSWDVDSTSIGDLKAVAASVDAVEQDKSILLAETDLTFASPGRQHLRFARFYDSAITSAFDGMGAGWRNTRYVLQFSRPSWFDENDLMRNSSGDPIGKDSQSNTKLRSGEIRFYDRATGQSVDFMSSLKLEYNVDGLGHPVIELSGLNASDTPIFSPGIRRNGSTLSQDGDKNYTLTLLDGSELKFDCEGRIQTVTDNLGYTITYVYDNSQLISIDDSADQSIVLDYQNDLLDSVTGPASERVEYSYTSGCLVEAKNMRNNGIVSYSYNPDKQLVGSVGIDGIQRLSSVPDLRGRSDQRQDVFGNIFDSSFTTNETTLERTTTTVDTNSAEYSAVQQKFDSTGRLLESVDPFGNTTQIGYYGDSSYPNTIVSPIPGRSPISIDRNSYGQPSRITDPELIAEGAHPKEITYNEKNLPEQVVNPAGQITLYEYNTAGDVNNITITLDGQDIVTRYEYNAEGYLEDIIDPNGVCVASYEYDSLGRVLSQFDSANIETTYVYDSLGRLSSVSHPMYSQPITYIYNNYDQVTEIITPSGSIYKEYDPTTHLLIAETDLNGMRQEYEYDAVTGVMLKTRQIVNGGVDNIETDIDYNRFGKVDSVQMSGGQVISYEYDKVGRQTVRNDENYSLISLTHPSNTLCTGSQYLITWIDNDNQGDAVISLYYDTDDAGSNGVLIADDLSEDADGSMGQYLWDVSDVPDGSYYIYAEMVTSDNETLTSYATGTVTIKDADIDNDGIVNLVDFAVLAASWLTQAGDLSYDVDCDLDNSGEVDIDDLLLLADDWLSGATAPPASAPMGAPPIPAPAMNATERSLAISDNSLLYEQYLAEHLDDAIAGIYDMIKWIDDLWEQNELGSMTEVEYKDCRNDLVEMLLELKREGVRMGF